MFVSFFNGLRKLMKMFFKLQSKLYILTILVKLAQNFCYHLFEYGIQHLKSPPYILELVTIVKCKHYHIVQTTLRLLHYRSMPLRFWSLAYQTIMYLINRMSTSMLNFHSFFDKIFNKTHNYHQFCIFGYLCYLGFIHTLYLKLKSHSHLCDFVGHSNEHNTYCFIDSKINRIFISCHVIFVKSIFPFKNSFSPTLSIPGHLLN